MDDRPTDHHESPETDTLQALRGRVLNVALVILAVALPLISITLIADTLILGTLTMRIMAPAAAMVVFPILWMARRRLGFRPSAIALLTLLALSALLLGSRGGITVGYAALCVLTIQLAALFFGRRGATLGVLAIVAVHLVAWTIVQQELGPPLEQEMWNPSSNALWLRQLVVLGLLGLVIAIGELYVVEQLAQSLVLYRGLAEREKAQRVALEESERIQVHEREQRALAQGALERSRRIEALARVAGGVAHDFNNVLTVILGTAEAAKTPGTSPEDVETYMDEIMEAAQKAAGLTNQLLALGRQQMSKPKNVSMTAWLGRLRPSIVRVLAADISLVLDLPKDDAVVCVDETGLDRAILNLVLNARDAMPRGGTLAISCERESIDRPHPPLSPGRYVMLTVSDDGLGMDTETIERVFDPFFTTKGDKGTGLGLSSVYAFAADAGGSVEVTSALGRGTTFMVCLPEVPAVVTAAVEESGRASQAQGRLRGRILVVEDRADVRATMTRLLRHHGFDVNEADDGDAALAQLARRTDFNLMCIDGVMPGVSTAQVIERASTLAPQMRVLVCSGHVQEELLRRGIETGRYAFLAKPFSPQELVDRVTQTLADEVRSTK